MLEAPVGKFIVIALGWYQLKDKFRFNLGFFF